MMGLFKWLYLEGEVDANPMLRVARPRRVRPEDVSVVTVTRAEVERMLAGTKGWQEFLCLTILAYTGVRRDAASRLSLEGRRSRRRHGDIPRQGE